MFFWRSWRYRIIEKETFDIAKIKQYKDIIIYGAGVVAREIYTCLISAPYNLTIRSFMVTDKTGNPKSIQGIPVIDIHHGEAYKESALILVAVMDRYYDEIAELLDKEGFCNVVSMTFESLNWCYVRGKYFQELFKQSGKMYLTLQDELLISKVISDDLSDVKIYRVQSHVDKTTDLDMSKYHWEVPIQAGAALTDVKVCEIQDNQGQNISDKNREYCELTALYWIWKNDHSKYAGLCHYRRHFLLTDELLRRLAVSDIDVVLTIPILNFPNVRDAYVHDHIEKDWDIMLEAIEKLQPEYRETAEEIQNSAFYCGYNMFIARKEILNAYCEWLFPILAYCENKCGEKEDAYQNRYIGFLAERLLTIYFMHHESKYKIAYANKEFCK